MNDPNCRRTRPIAILLPCALLLTLVPRQQVSAQSKAPAKSSLCTRDIALDTTRQQADISKTFNDPVRRITVLIRAADLLWPYQQDRARAVFTEAFALALEQEKEVEEKGPQSIILRMQKPDQRHVVIRAVAKRDSAWAKELAQQMFKPANDGESLSTKGSFENELNAHRLLDSARSLIDTDIKAAFELARASLNYPASSALTRFLYRLAEVNQQAADEFYSHALTAYSDRPMRQFLYLQAYPFAWHETLNTPIFSFYIVPPNFVTNQALQRRFVQVLLRRAQQALETPPDEADAYQNAYQNRFPGKVHLLHGMMKLEPQVGASLPDLLPALTQAKEKILVTLSVETQRLVQQPGRETSTAPEKTFDEQMELAQKEPDLDERDHMIALAVMHAAEGKEPLADVVQAIEKISDSTLRAYFLEWFYFQRAATAVKQRQFEEAEKLTSKVEGWEQRAYLHTEIAKGLLRKSDTQTHGREVLDEAVTEARKAGATIFAARTLLTASNLYGKIDLNRSISVLADAVNATNRLDTPDFFGDDQAVEKTPERRRRGGEYSGEYVLRFYMPGLDPESAFREMARIEVDTALSQSNGLTDKFQRALATLGVAEVCLQQAPVGSKEKPKKSGRP